MVQIETLNEGAFGSALVRLGPGEQFVSESGSMFRASPNIQPAVSTMVKGKGGILKGIKRMLGGDKFFMATYSTTDGGPGEVGLAPVLQGEVRVVDVSPAMPWVCSGGSYMGSTVGLDLDSQFQGLIKGTFSGENYFFMKVSGQGQMLVNAFGRISEIQIEGSLTVDTGHVVAYEASLEYKLGKAGKGWIGSWLAGEGIVMKFTGNGKILVQSHNPKDFGWTLGPMLPPR